MVEVQIRTYRMHEEAENGVAAHWAYVEAKAKGVREEILEEGRIFAPSEKLAWVRQLVDWQKEITDAEEFLRVVKFDALKHRNFVFSPKGDVYDLPAGATPVDFAYAVHTQLGSCISGAKVDGRMTPLDYKLQSGQVVEIIKSKTPKGPNSRWLEFVVTTLARDEINKHLRKKEKVS
jgi:GTP pyrophosphokinase